ncbi:MAG: hypothetical protein U0133_10655 [Gemmatimonadales bacterium]
MLADRSQQPGTHTRDSVERLQAAKGAPGLPVGDDHLGKVETNAGEAGNLERAGLVEVDPLSLRQGPGEGEARIAVGRGPARGGCREEGELAGWGVRGAMPESKRLAAQGQAQQQQDGPPFGSHA